MTVPDPDNLGFTFRVTKDNQLLVSRDGRLVTTLRGEKAVKTIDKLSKSDLAAQQQLLARVTGNYKRGNE